MYKVTREEASSLLKISTRSIDRYIRAWKLRSKKDWKIVYINQDDINNFLWNWNSKVEILNENKENSLWLSTKNQDEILSEVYYDLKNQIFNKDTEIRSLYSKIWMLEEHIKNSISLLEYKKNQFLLEESKITILSELENTKWELDRIKKELFQEKKLNYITIIVSTILLLALLIIWFIKI